MSIRHSAARAESAVRRGLPIALIVAAMIGLKVAILAAGALPFNGDEAIVALMARHILNGARPAFFYGQAYLGSLDAWLVAIAFSTFGQSVVAIRIVQIALFAGTLITTYRVAIRLGLDVWASRWAVLWMALPPTLLTLYTTATLGGYGETLLFGNILILIALSISAPTEQRPNAHWTQFMRWGLLGCMAGFAFWSFGLILVYLIPLSIWLLVRHRLAAWRGYIVAGIGFAIGSAPWWLTIGQLGGSLIGELTGSAVAGTLAAPTLLDGLGVRLISFFVFGLPAWLGLRYPWSPEFVLPLAGVAVAAIYLGAFVMAIRRGPRLLWGMIGVLLLTYLITPFGGDPSGRYFVPLYLPLSIFMAMLIGRLRNQLVHTVGLPMPGCASGLVGLVVALIVGYNVAGTVLAVAQPHGITTQFDHVTWIERGREQELIDFLLAHGETRGYTNYWVAYPIAFLSGEQIVSAARLPYHLDLRYTRRDDRYAPYSQAVAESPRAFYITTNHPRLDDLIRTQLSALGVTVNEETIGSYHVFYSLSRKVEPEELGLGETTP